LERHLAPLEFSEMVHLMQCGKVSGQSEDCPALSRKKRGLGWPPRETALRPALPSSVQDRLIQFSQELAHSTQHKLRNRAS